MSAPDAGRPAADAARLAAFDALRAVDEQGAYANLVLPELLRAAGLGGRDAALATELAYGTLRARGSYDAVIAACSSRPLSEVDPPVLDVLRLGAHQLLATRIPPHAAVSATVAVARARCGPARSGFVNAVLRKVSARSLQGWLAEVAPGDDDAAIAVRSSHPAWIVRAMRDALRAAGRDPGELPALLAADNQRPRVTLCALPGLLAPGEPAVAGAEPGMLSPCAVRLAPSTGAPGDLAAVRQGRARVQDEGSQLVALALAAVPVAGDGGRWADLCAGPGGKAALLAATLRERRAAGGLPPGAELLAVETAPHRARLVRAALAALPGTTEVRIADGRMLGAEQPAWFDRVLVDAPCTGLGSLRRRPEARWRHLPGELAGLGMLQRALLASALDAARPGGVVGYATCSPHLAETGLLVDDVLRRRDDVERLDTPAAVAAVTASGALPDPGAGPYLQLWPHLHGTDGMFLALLRRH